MNGLLIINKEKGYTSRDVVNVISKTFNTTKVGHTGTLDPIATGVMVIAIGNALKVVDILTSDIKEYIATVKLGIETDTLDVTGNIINQSSNYQIVKSDLESVLKFFLGKSIQEVPLYSAVKVNGKRLYEYARNNIDVELPKRKIEIFDIELLKYSNDSFSFRVVVSKGTYIRSLIRDIGKKLSILTCMENLVRTRQGKFLIEDSYTLDEVKNGNFKLLNVIDYINGYEIVKADDYLSKKILNGGILENRYKSEKIAFVDKDNNLIGLYELYNKDTTKVKPIKILTK